VYHVAHRGILSGLGTIGRNVELENFTSAMYEAREIAIERMQYEAASAKAEGVVGVEIHEGSHGWQTHVIEFFAIGTAVLPLEQEVAPEKSKTRSWCCRSTISQFCGLANAGFPRKFGLAKSFGWDQVPLTGPMASSVLNHSRKEADDVEVLLQRRAQPDQGRVVSRRDRPALRSDSGRYPQGRAAQAGLFSDQSEGQAAGYGRWRRHRVRFKRDPAVSRGKNRKIPAGEHRQGARRAALLDVLRRLRDRPLCRPVGALPQLCAGEDSLCAEPLRLRRPASF